jgi:hypothetical protein
VGCPLLAPFFLPVVDCPLKFPGVPTEDHHALSAFG